MSISLLGLISNTVSFVVLRKSDGNEIFKKLLLTLGKRIWQHIVVLFN